jgi:hypothetical protein
MLPCDIEIFTANMAIFCAQPNILFTLYPTGPILARFSVRRASRCMKKKEQCLYRYGPPPRPPRRALRAHCQPPGLAAGMHCAHLLSPRLRFGAPGSLQPADDTSFRSTPRPTHAPLPLCPRLRRPTPGCWPAFRSARQPTPRRLAWGPKPKEGKNGGAERTILD